MEQAVDYTITWMDDENSFHSTYMEAPYPYDKQPRSYCYPFKNLNLTEFEVKVADNLCSIEWANQDVRYQLDHYHNQLQGITIASLVLNALTVSCILAYLVYSLYAYCRRPKQSVTL
ncbi:unnamed protein product [Absidia cylindrospora]